MPCIRHVRTRTILYMIHHCWKGVNQDLYISPIYFITFYHIFLFHSTYSQLLSYIFSFFVIYLFLIFSSFKHAFFYILVMYLVSVYRSAVSALFKEGGTLVAGGILRFQFSSKLSKVEQTWVLHTLFEASKTFFQKKLCNCSLLSLVLMLITYIYFLNTQLWSLGRVYRAAR